LTLRKFHTGPKIKKSQLADLRVFISTGVLSDIKAIAQTVKSISPETLVIVDGVCSVGSEEIRFDDWKLDIIISGSQKGLGVPPGLSVVVASQQALEVYKSRTTPIVAYYSNWKKWLPSKCLL
jgi:alanine-glyoxylate transaminase/serine-glyoxylate transaminase/serine-pyruvate transaminase